jgi:hypothetical protein
MSPVTTELPETFFLRLTSSWGWATWRRAFDQFEPDAGKLLAQLQQRDLLETFNLGGAYDYAAQLEANATGRLRTWAVQWYATLLLKNGLGLFPRHSLVENLGFDGSGMHGQETDNHLTDAPTMAKIGVTRLPLSESAEARRALRNFLREPRRERWARRWRQCWTNLRRPRRSTP